MFFFFNECSSDPTVNNASYGFKKLSRQLSVVHEIAGHKPLEILSIWTLCFPLKFSKISKMGDSQCMGFFLLYESSFWIGKTLFCTELLNKTIKIGSKWKQCLNGSFVHHSAQQKTVHLISYFFQNHLFSIFLNRWLKVWLYELTH